MTPKQRWRLTAEYRWSLVGAISIVAFGFLISGLQVPPMGYYWASLVTVIAATGRRIFDALTIIHTQQED